MSEAIEQSYGARRNGRMVKPQIFLKTIGAGPRVESINVPFVLSIGFFSQDDFDELIGIHPTTAESLTTMEITKEHTNLACIVCQPSMLFCCTFSICYILCSNNVAFYLALSDHFLLCQLSFYC